MKTKAKVVVSAPSMDVAQCLTDVSSYKGELATIWLGLSPLSAFRYRVLRRSFCLASLPLLKWQLTFWNVLTSAHRVCGAQREWPPSSRAESQFSYYYFPFVNPLSLKMEWAGEEVKAWASEAGHHLTITRSSNLDGLSSAASPAGATRHKQSICHCQPR